MNKTLVKCSKCGSFNVVEGEIVPPSPKPVAPRIISMEQHVKENKTTSLQKFNVIYGDNAIRGNSHMKKMFIECLDCGHKLEWDQVVYT